MPRPSPSHPIENARGDLLLSPQQATPQQSTTGPGDSAVRAARVRKEDASKSSNLRPARIDSSLKTTTVRQLQDRQVSNPDEGLLVAYQRPPVGIQGSLRGSHPSILRMTGAAGDRLRPRSPATPHARRAASLQIRRRR